MTTESPPSSLDRRTIDDFGAQWRRFPRFDGFVAAPTFLQDVFGPLLDAGELRGAHVAEIGSGQGRIVRMLLEHGVRHAIAVEPSDAFEVMRANLNDRVDRVTPMQVTGDRLPASQDLDFVFSIGVLHHIEDPGPTVRAAMDALKPGGRMLIWLYGREGNEGYVAAVNGLRRLSRGMPHAMLISICHALCVFATLYAKAAKYVKVPMRDYFTDIFASMSWRMRLCAIYDQLRPAHAKYYTREEAIRLLESAGFKDVKCHHRHGYSWTVIGTK
jgi:SAM-dependent methyltransferase